MTKPIIRRKLGATNLALSPIGLGCWQFSKGVGMVGKYWPTLEDDVVVEMVRIALEGGINWFDTAEIYGHGASEKVLAKALDTLSVGEEEAQIATKWWPMFRRASNIPKTIQDRYNCLNGRTIDLYQIHQPFSFSSVKSEMVEMARLYHAGAIRAVGVSNFSAKAMREADKVLGDFGIRLASNQVKYSLLDRRIEQNGILETAQELGVSIIAYSPLEQGLLSGKFHRKPELAAALGAPRKWQSGFKPAGLAKSLPLIELLEQLALKYEVSTSQVALNALIYLHGETIFAIPGGSKLHHVEENVGALTFRLTEEEIQQISVMSLRVLRKGVIAND